MPNTRYDVGAATPVTFVNTFEVTSDPADFERIFADISEFMAAQPGFIRYTLSRNVSAEKPNQYVNIALWDDVESWRAAISHPGFQAHAREIRARATNVANMYEPRQAYAAR